MVSGGRATGPSADPNGLNTKMGHLRGRCPSGRRLRMSLPHRHRRTTTFAGPRLDGLDSPLPIDGPMTDDAFLAYVHAVLVPMPCPATP